MKEDLQDRCGKFLVKYGAPPEIWLPFNDFIQSELSRQKKDRDNEISSDAPDKLTAKYEQGWNDGRKELLEEIEKEVDSVIDGCVANGFGIPNHIKKLKQILSSYKPNSNQ